MVGWLVSDLGVCPFCGLSSITVSTLRRRNGGTYLRYEVVVWQPESHPGDLVVIVGLVGVGVGAGGSSEV